MRKGIPQHFRGLVWQLLTNANKSQQKDMYPAFLKQQSACERIIQRDLDRTFPEHEFFKERDGCGQEALFHVMKVIHSSQIDNQSTIYFINSMNTHRRFQYSIQKLATVKEALLLQEFYL